VANHYDTLGIPTTANSTQIRAAYKQLALRYHPDRNPGFPEAEEIFKKVNEAYHVLSDPVKKLNYDAGFILLPPQSQANYAREMKRRRYWYYFVRNQDRPYKIDKEYFKIQGLAFAVFIVISGFCFALVHTANYIMQQRHLKKYNANSLSLKKVDALFGSGQYDDAFHLIESLHKQNPGEYRFSYARDSLVSVLKNLADTRFDEKDFAGAVSYYFKLENYEQPTRSETLQRISLCQFYLGNYKEALQAMKHLHNQDPRNLRLVYEIGIINLDYLENTEEALQYFTLGKKLFKENLSQIYGEAFEIIVNPYDLPDIYLDIFEGRARCNLALRNYEEAVTDCNWAVFLRPQRGLGYYIRAQANASLGIPEKICSDLSKARDRGIENTKPLEKEFCNGRNKSK
jgi:curved DNA-binding protein CbpA